MLRQGWAAKDGKPILVIAGFHCKRTRDSNKENPGIGRLVLSFWIRVLVFFLSSKGNCWSGTPIIGFDEWMAEVVPVCGGGLAVDSWTVVSFGSEGTFNSVRGMFVAGGGLSFTIIYLYRWFFGYKTEMVTELLASQFNLKII